MVNSLGQMPTHTCRRRRQPQFGDAGRVGVFIATPHERDPPKYSTFVLVVPLGAVPVVSIRNRNGGELKLKLEIEKQTAKREAEKVASSVVYVVFQRPEHEGADGGYGYVEVLTQVVRKERRESKGIRDRIKPIRARGCYTSEKSWAGPEGRTLAKREP